MSKENSVAAPSLIKGERVILEPLAAQRSEDLLKFYEKNRAFLKAFSPTWPKDFFQESFWQRKIWASSQDWESDKAYRFVLKSKSGEIIGNINLSQVCRGAFQNAYLGYAVDEDYQGQGIMTEAVSLVTKFTFEKIKLHRLQANTLVDNIGSQKVLLKNGFNEEGLAKNYLEIDGSWCNHKLFASTNPDY